MLTHIMPTDPELASDDAARTSGTWRCVAGIDGCRAGWFVVRVERSPGETRSFVAPTIDAAFAELGACTVIGIDIPMGLVDSGPRSCDVLARELLSPARASSVFPAPIRPALGAADYQAACELRESIDGRRMSLQTFHILPKIAEVDRFLRRHPDASRRIYEIHPELAFAALQEGRPVPAPKRKAEGFRQRYRLLERFVDGEALETALSAYPRTVAARDDVMDAFAVVLAAQRIASGMGQRVPAERELDAAGIDMAIWF